jgi:hypothetical protein
MPASQAKPPAAILPEPTSSPSASAQGPAPAPQAQAAPSPTALGKFLSALISAFRK